MSLSPREAGRAGRHDGRQLFRPGRIAKHFLDAALAAPQLHGASDEARLIYRFAFREGWLAAASTANQTQE